MNAPLRRVGIVMIIMFALLFANLNWVQGYKAAEYRSSPYNSARVEVELYQRERGPILVGPDGTAVARSVETDGRLVFLRTYPEDDLYSHAVGYRPVQLESTGLERAMDDFLAGTGDRFFVDRIRDLFTGDLTIGGTVATTLLDDAQRTAADQLRDNPTGTNRGAVVALDPRTGAVQALVSLPGFDPNPLASHDPATAQDAFATLAADPDRPLVNRALRTDSVEEVEGEARGAAFHPGSVFKVIMAAAALQREYDPDTRIPAGPSYVPPTAPEGDPITNASPGICPQSQVTLAVALQDSCNTGFAQLGVELGRDAVIETAQAFGFGDDGLRLGRLDGSGTPVTASQTGPMARPDGQPDPPTVAQSSIGQASVVLSPLLAAMLAGTVANDGVQMHPYLVDRLQDAQLREIYRASPEQLRRPISPEVAADLRDMMVGVVERGSGQAAGVSGFLVGGKTGTAEVTSGEPEHGWFIGFLIADGQPVTAVAVMLENAGPAGSRAAAEIAGRVMRAVVEGDD